MALVPTRRRLLQTATLGCAANALIRPKPAAATPTEPSALAPRRLFFQNPDRSFVRLSLDGRTIAWLEPRDSILNIMAAPVDEPTRSRQLTHAKDRSVSGVFVWAWTNRHIVFFDSAGDENYRAYSIDLDSGATLPLTPAGGVRADVQQSSCRFANEMLFTFNARDRKLFDLVRIDVPTGESQPHLQNPGFESVVTGNDFTVLLGRRFLPDGSAELQKWDPDGTWSSFAKIPAADVMTTWPDGISADQRSVFMIDSRGRDTAALLEIDLATRETQVLAEDSQADIVEAAYDPDTERPYAAVSFAARKRWHLIDPAYAFDLARLRAAQGDGEVAIGSQSTGSARTVAIYYRSDAAAEYRIYDRNRRTVTFLFKSTTDLDNVPLSVMQPVVIPASDGVNLPGYLTLPADGTRNGPMVLAIHGGPYARDVWGYSGTHQWLANRGYGVLSVNYRGSTGFGKHFVNIADQGWGGRMQDDLTDAAAWTVTQGYADPKRIGFFGASYGGFAALTAATKTPETFACIVDVFGPSNLVTMMRSFPPYWSTWLSMWKQRLADPETEAGRQWLTERSPLIHADRIVRPMLIAQGLLDVRVTPEESEQIVQAMRNRNIPVTYCTFSDEGHGLVRQENRIAFSAVMEAFLAQHLGGRAEPLGDAFAGSTIKFEVGRELIRGIG
jgi:dipeptidyl aminopeptidase/acylaminoacyl peptidase